MTKLSVKSKLFITAVLAAGAVVLADSFLHWQSANWSEFLVLLLAALLASRLRVRMPGVTGTMSVNLPFILFAVAEMPLAQALLIGCLSILVQWLPQKRQSFNWIQGLFNFANIALAVAATGFVYNSPALQSAIPSRSLLLGSAVAAYYAVNSIPVAIVIALTEKKSVTGAWITMIQLSYPYYLASAGVAVGALSVSMHLGWQAPLVVLPLMIGVFYSYQRYFTAASVPEPEREHAPQTAAVARALS